MDIEDRIHSWFKEHPGPAVAVLIGALFLGILAARPWFLAPHPWFFGMVTGAMGFVIGRMQKGRLLGLFSLAVYILIITLFGA